MGDFPQPDVTLEFLGLVAPPFPLLSPHPPSFSPLSSPPPPPPGPPRIANLFMKVAFFELVYFLVSNERVASSALGFCMDAEVR